MEETVDGTAVEEEKVPQPDAIIVFKTTDDKGNISTTVAMEGNIQATEVQTLLELAINGWRQRIGLTR